jgi:hypothetical protein
MKIWPWILVLGVLFLITYDPRSGNLAKYYTDPIVENGPVHGEARETPGET